MDDKKQMRLIMSFANSTAFRSTYPLALHHWISIGERRYGDDIRVYRFFKAQDTGFFCSYIVCLVLFSLELTLQAMVVEGYFYARIYEHRCIEGSITQVM